MRCNAFDLEHGVVAVTDHAAVFPNDQGCQGGQALLVAALHYKLQHSANRGRFTRRLSSLVGRRFPAPLRIPSVSMSLLVDRHGALRGSCFMVDDLTVDEALRAFFEKRDWGQFHTPANLAKSISIEAGELLECFQWTDSAPRDRVLDELAMSLPVHDFSAPGWRSIRTRSSSKKIAGDRGEVSDRQGAWSKCEVRRAVDRVDLC